MSAQGELGSSYIDMGRDNTRNKAISSNTAESSPSSNDFGGVANNEAPVRRLRLGSEELSG